MTLQAQDPAVLTEDLSKRFRSRRGVLSMLRHPWRPGGRVTALDRVSLEVRQGEVFGLLGPNGAGKTTLLKVLACLVVPDEGRARVNGSDIDGDEIGVKRSIGYVTSDERSFYWRLTGAQNLTFFARLFHVAAGEIPSRVSRLLERVGLSDKAHEPFSAYSSGMKQRLSIARALLHDPPVLFLDEPTRSLDPMTARHIRRFIRDELVGADGKTILLATHNLQEAADLCHRMAILSRARLHRVGRLDEFRALFAADRIYRLGGGWPGGPGGHRPRTARRRGRPGSHPRSHRRDRNRSAAVPSHRTRIGRQRRALTAGGPPGRGAGARLRAEPPGDLAGGSF